MEHLITVEDLSKDEILELIKLAKKYKTEKEQHVLHQPLKGKTLGMFFEKHSTRTRLTFDIAMNQLGGHSVHLNAEDLHVGSRDSFFDTINVLSRYIDVIMIRSNAHHDVEKLAEISSVPVINGQTNHHNPCQALADLFTIYEYKDSFENIKLAYVGDANNIANSLLLACAKVGINISIATPEGFECDQNVVNTAISFAKQNMSEVKVTNNISETVRNADVVYTSAWFANRYPDKEERIKVLKEYQVNGFLLSIAKDDCLFMHSLPAFRGMEVSPDILDGHQSIILDQSENKLYMQKAILQMILG